MENHWDRFEHDIWASQFARDTRKDMEFFRQDVAHVRWLFSMVDKRAQIHLNECEIISDINNRLKNIEEKLNIESPEYVLSDALAQRKENENGKSKR